MVVTNKLTTARIISTILSLTSALFVMYINSQIALSYTQSDGKTQALFGITELLVFGHKYWILIPAAFSLLLAVWVVRTNTFRIWDGVTILSALLAILGVMTPFWKLLV